jgi:hypothetical protein
MGMKDFKGSSRVEDKSPSTQVLDLHDQAAAILSEREQDYGDATTFFTQVATAASAITKKNLSAYDCCVIFLMGKLVRFNEGLDCEIPSNTIQKAGVNEKILDNLRDGMNYIGFLNPLTKDSK